MASVEGVAVRLGARAGNWVSTRAGAGYGSGSSAERIAAARPGCDRWDEACFRWCCGHEDASTRAEVWALLMERGAAMASAQRWPKGMLSRLVGLALSETRPRQTAECWTDAQRMRACGWGLSQAAWARTWGVRYRALRGEVERRDRKVAGVVEG